MIFNKSYIKKQIKKAYNNFSNYSQIAKQLCDESGKVNKKTAKKLQKKARLLEMQSALAERQILLYKKLASKV